MRSRDTATVVCGVTTMAAAVFAVGGALRWTQALVAILMTLTLIPFVWSRRGLVGTSPLVVLISLAAVFTAVQLIPMPGAVMSSLDPVNEKLRVEGSQLADVSPWHAITCDAPGTIRALAFFIILLGIAIFALRL